MIEPYLDEERKKQLIRTSVNRPRGAFIIDHKKNIYFQYYRYDQILTMYKDMPQVIRKGVRYYNISNEFVTITCDGKDTVINWNMRIYSFL